MTNLRTRDRRKDDRRPARELEWDGKGKLIGAEYPPARRQVSLHALLLEMTTFERKLVDGDYLARRAAEVRAAEDLVTAELIYRAMYEHQGGKWESVETKWVWRDIANRLNNLRAHHDKGE